MAAVSNTEHADEVSVSFEAMACDGEIRLAGLAPQSARRLAESAVAEVRRIEAKYSRFRADSIVSAINAAAGSGRAVAVDAETAGLLDFADGLHAISGGCFDITSGVLQSGWDFRRGRIPSRDELESLLGRVGWEHTRLRSDAEPVTVELLRPGMSIDFGGFGKEYAADRAASVLQRGGAVHGWVNLGGDIRLIGPRPDGSPWRMAIRHPRQEDRMLASIAMSRGALATSGDYERSFIGSDGQRHCHVLDPRDGCPVRHWQSVSVVASNCSAAGALTTIAMLLREHAIDFLDAQGVRWLAVDAEGRIHRSAAAAEDGWLKIAPGA
ncbi:FAD:protein FMN transferase [Rhizobacter sp. AJA081-3]|uniref:FAD:protein FMN transferase n=1 Tax=Rhizobacter sp. AJA081-3 TaxID=2753607 RepID=UPI001ADFBE07|nr:FAD:protein FMN transferase [Rhizobacter sp. AJA081-3]QTN25698.1 FAD:protein FMN transferase [Rhizobacter sp. AJA081-3]